MKRTLLLLPVLASLVLLAGCGKATPVETVTPVTSTEIAASATTGFEQTLLFPEQTKMPGNYSGNTAVLRAYVNGHMQTVKIPSDATQGTITFTFNQEPVIRHNTVTFYANVPTLQHTMRWMRLNLTEASIANGEYQFDLKDFAVIYGKTGFSFNLLDEMKGKDIKLSTFVGERNNRVKSIVIAVQ